MNTYTQLLAANNRNVLSAAINKTGYKFIRAAIIIVLSIINIFSTALPASAMSSDQRTVYQMGINYFDDEVRSCSNGGADLIGSDNEQKAWNFFKGQGLDDIHTAAVLGNIKQESGFNPTIMEIGGNSNTPSDADPKGWGLVQWTPGSKVVGIASGFGVSGPIYELGTQLNVIWEEMVNQTPTSYKDFITPFKKTTTLTSATEFFRKNFEAGTAGARQQYAQEMFDKYGGSSAGGTTSVSANGCAGGGSTQCNIAQGNAKILCAAKVYDPVSYKEVGEAGHQGGTAWHATCPTVDASCILDCSGLVNIAVYDVFGVDLRENTGSIVTDTTHWLHISVNDLQAGDLIMPNAGHVEIVDHVSGNTIYTFGAHSANRPQPEQVGPTQYSKSQIETSLRWIGPTS